ncbi:MAG: hypothetical protein ACXU9U_03660, partial [Parachlamydiaceae bacterium]
MFKNNIGLLIFIHFFGFSGLPVLEADPFIPPSDKQLNVFTLKKIQKALEVRKVEKFDISLFSSITKKEKEGFLGYHGDSLDFYIYQDIIR